MLPSVKPLLTALPPFCHWKPSTMPLAALLLLLYSCSAWPKVAAPVKLALAFTNMRLALLAPRVTLPSAVSALPAVMLTGLLMDTGAVKLAAA